MRVVKWLVNNEPVWLASAIMSVVGFAVFVAGKYGFDQEIGAAVMSLLPVLVAPLTRRATTSNAKVSQAVEVAARTGDSDAGKAVAEVKP